MGRGLPPAPAIKISERQFKLLSSESKKRTLPHGLKTRIEILLKSSLGKGNSWVCSELGICINKIKRWRKRWESYYEEIVAFEKGPSGEGVSDKALLEKMINCIKDAPRKGTPKKFIPEEEQKITAIACQKPEEHGFEVTKWTHKLLAKAAVKKGIIKEISASTVGLILKKTN